MKIIGLIPARAGSKRLLNKNLADLDGRPLIAHTCQTALASGVLSAVCVNTDNSEIAAVAQHFGVECPVLRPANLARDDTPTNESNRFMLEFLAGRGQAYDAVMVLQPTSPLRSADDICGALELYEANVPCAVVSVSPVSPAAWLGHIGKDGRFEPLPGRDVLYRLNGAIYLYEYEDYLHGRRPPRTLVYAMPTTRGVDIDTLEDLKYAQFLLRERIMQPDLSI